MFKISIASDENKLIKNIKHKLLYSRLKKALKKEGIKINNNNKNSNKTVNKINLKILKIIDEYNYLSDQALKFDFIDFKLTKEQFNKFYDDNKQLFKYHNTIKDINIKNKINIGIWFDRKKIKYEW